MSSKTLYFAGNWKMNHWVSESEAYLIALTEQLAPLFKSPAQFEVGLFPPASHFGLFHQFLGGSTIHWGAQDVGPGQFGAFTGENSPAVVKELGGIATLVGHSERRHVFGESHSMVFEKTQAALSQGLRVILCVGEKLEERKKEATFDVLTAQLEAFKPGAIKDFAPLDIAYEPVWAIGTGETASPEMAQETHQWIRQWISTHWGPQQAQASRILYGGSVKPDNAQALMSQKDIDGLLVGGASLDATKFAQLIKNGLESAQLNE